MGVDTTTYIKRDNPGRALGRTSHTPVPSSPGTYILILEASARRRIRIGALGMLELNPGFYAYVGSARGSGGLAARLAHHRRRTRSPHWHVDYLRCHTVFREVWLAQGAAELEHGWAGVLGSIRTASIPLARFGATDCGCRSHLFRFTHLPRVSAFRRRLAASGTPVGVLSRAEVMRWIPPHTMR